jgi:hypothetical protein
MRAMTSAGVATVAAPVASGVACWSVPDEGVAVPAGVGGTPGPGTDDGAGLLHRPVPRGGGT